MKIMLINHYAGSPKMGMEYRPFYLAKEWQKNGHEVVIIAASQAHVRSKQISLSSDYQEETVEGVNYLWVKTPPYEGNGFARVLNMRVFVKFLKSNAKTLAEKHAPDVVIASSTYPLDNYPAHKIARFAGAKYFYEVHDLWPLSPKELGGMSPWHPFILWMQRAENYAYKHVDGVISMLPKTQDHMKAHGLDLRKWNYIPNGVSVEDWKQSVPLGDEVLNQLKEIKIRFSKIIAYTGSFGIANALDNFILAASKMQDINVAFVMVGSGPEKKNLFDLKERLQLNNVFFIPPILKTQIPVLLKNFDILYVGLQKQSLFRFGISPNKLIDYMISSKPIIQAIEAGNSMVDEADCGLAIPPEDPNSLVNAINHLLSLPEKKSGNMGINGHNYALQNHDYKMLAKKFIQAIERA